MNDLRDFDEAVESGEECIPANMVRRLVDGEQPVRVWREYRGMSQDELAGNTGLSPEYLSQLENGTHKGSARELSSIARVLNVDIDDLLI